MIFRLASARARRCAGAVGLWQFMLPTGKMFGLKASSYVDEGEIPEDERHGFQSYL